MKSVGLELEVEAWRCVVEKHLRGRGLPYAAGDPGVAYGLTPVLYSPIGTDLPYAQSLVLASS